MFLALPILNLVNSDFKKLHCVSPQISRARSQHSPNWISWASMLSYISPYYYALLFLVFLTLILKSPQIHWQSPFWVWDFHPTLSINTNAKGPVKPHLSQETCSNPFSLYSTPTLRSAVTLVFCATQAIAWPAALLLGYLGFSHMDIFCSKVKVRWRHLFPTPVFYMEGPN